MITLEQAKNLKLGTILYDRVEHNADGSPVRWRVNGKVKTWKTRPQEFRIPVKYGLYDYSYITEKTIGSFALTEEGAKE